MSFLKPYQQRVEAALDQCLPTVGIPPSRLHEAMRYATLSSGKRLRPALVYITGNALGASNQTLDNPACAIELIHAYSLVHDDLPAMDDDDLRRGHPTCHIQFDEATAILVGDALQTQAFSLLSTPCASTPEHQQPEAKTTLKMIQILAQASGSRGMAGGQMMDLSSVGQQRNLAELEDMYIHKTGALIRASVLLGALSANADQSTLKKLDHFGKCIGLAFQIQDDILDVEGHSQITGKHQGMDELRNKPTYPSLLGLNDAKKVAEEHYQDALSSLEGLDIDTTPLVEITKLIINRQH
jgi:geranylgeranyl pyrophosphate synthase